MVLYMLKQLFIKIWPVSKYQFEQSVKSLSEENKAMIAKNAEELQVDLNLLQSKLNEDLQEAKRQLKDEIDSSYQDLTEKIQESLQQYSRENKSLSDNLKDDLKKDIKEVRMAQYQKEQPLDIRFDRGYYASFDVSPSPKFQQDFLSLVRGLDKESVETVVLALQRLRYIQGAKWNTSDLYSEEEKIEARKIKEHFQKAVFPISDECFYYNGYMLPLNHFESCVFWDHCGVRELDNPEYFKDKDIIDAGAFIGSMLVMGIILFLSVLIKNSVMLLIAGIMIGYVTSSVISLLNFFSTAEGVHSYVIWGLGSFGGVSLQQLPFFACAALLGLICALLMVKPLNALLLGTRYAENLGINVRHVRALLLLITGLLTAVTTAFCGPVSFIGLAVPHIARLLLGTSNHNVLLPVTLVAGAVIALLCNLLCILPGELGTIPLNAVTPVIGAPVIIYVILRRRSIHYLDS